MNPLSRTSVPFGFLVLLILPTMAVRHWARMLDVMSTICLMMKASCQSNCHLRDFFYLQSSSLCFLRLPLLPGWGTPWMGRFLLHLKVHQTLYFWSLAGQWTSFLLHPCLSTCRSSGRFPGRLLSLNRRTVGFLMWLQKWHSFFRFPR